MGSHGGATPEGQLALLAGYGVAEKSMGVPVRPSMEVAPLGVSAAAARFSGAARRSLRTVYL